MNQTMIDLITDNYDKYMVFNIDLPKFAKAVAEQVLADAGTVDGDKQAILERYFGE